jgi:hypothetical protein
MTTLEVAFERLVNTLRQVKTVKSIKVLDEGALTLTLSQYGFDEQIAIYLLAGELSVGFIKKVINGNTRSDIHTLFIVSRDLLPEQGGVDESLQLLLDLYGGKVYIYDVHDRTVDIRPAYVAQHSPPAFGEPVNVARMGSDYADVSGSKHVMGVKRVVSFTSREYAHRQAEERPHADDPLQPFFDLLGVAVTASEEDIRRAYRKKARQYHPDMNPSPTATARMQQINEAYEQIMKRFE